MSYKQFDLIRRLENPIPKNQRHKYSIKDVKKDGFIQIKKELYHVEPFGRFFDNEDEWFELRVTNVLTGNTTYLEWEEDDDLSIYLSTKEIDFSDLRDDENGEIDGEDLDQITDEEDDIFFNGKKFEYDDDYKAQYVRVKDGKKFNVYMWDFEAKDGECITIENWADHDERPDYEIWLAKEISNKHIEIISLGN